MGDQDDVARIVDQMLLEPLDALGIEVVGRLVEQQDRRLLEQQAGQRDPPLLAARQRRDRRIARRTAQRVHCDLELVVEAPAVDRVDLLLKLAHLGHQRIEIGVGGRIAHQHRNRVEPLHHVGDRLHALANIFHHRLGLVELGLLLQITDRDVGPRPGFPGEFGIPPGHDLHQGRFAGPVGTDDPDLGVRVKLQRNSVENGLGGTGKGLAQTLHDEAILGGHGVACVLVMG